MFNNVALDVVIGLVFIFLLYSLLATILQEIIATFFSLRAKKLKEAIKRMLEDDGSSTDIFVNAYYDHPLTKYLGIDSKSKTASYFKPGTFSKVVIDLLKGDNNLKPGIDIRPLIQHAMDTGSISWDPASKNSSAKKIGDQTGLFLKSIWAESSGDVEKFKALLENWFDETMERATGWYKKYTQRILFFIGLSLAIIFNVDSLSIAHKLEKDPELRAQIVQQADAFVKAHPNLDKEVEQIKNINSGKTPLVDSSGKPVIDSLGVNTDSLKQLQIKRDSLVALATKLVKEDIKKTNDIMGLGWSNWNEGNMNCVLFFLISLIGWIITALAISLGAPFWFDILNKIMKLRNSTATESGDSKNKNEEVEQARLINRKG